MMIAARTCSRRLYASSTSRVALRQFETPRRRVGQQQEARVLSMIVRPDADEERHRAAAAALLLFVVSMASGTRSMTMMDGESRQAVETEEATATSVHSSSYNKAQIPTVFLASSLWGGKKRRPKLPRPQDVTSVPHRDVTIWRNKKDGRLLFLFGALNHSALSADQAGLIVKELKPDAVFLDINEQLFSELGIDKRVENRLGSADGDDTWKKIILQPEVEQELSEIPDFAASKGMMTTFEDPVEKSIKGMFGQLRFAGLKRGDEKVASWTHYVSAVEAGQRAGSDIVLGGRDAGISKQRRDEAMRKSNRAEASELVFAVHPNWKTDLTPRENLTTMRDLMDQKAPALYQVMFAEADAHTATKISQLTGSKSIVAVVMMIHVSGVEQQLHKKDWEQVSTW